MEDHMLDIMNVDGYELSDYGGGDYKIPKPPFTFQDYKIQYNQKAWSKMGCSIGGPATAISALTGVEFTEGQMQSYWKQALKRGASDTSGWSMKGGVNLMLDMYNSNSKKKLMYVREEVGSPKFYEWLDKGYQCVIGGRFNSSFYADILNDGDLDNIDFGVPSFGHILSVYKTSVIRTVDNYKDRDYNVFSLTTQQLEELRSRGQVFLSAYFFCVEDAYNAVNGYERPTWAESAYKELGHLLDDYTGTGEVDFIKFQWMLKKYGVISEVKEVRTEDEALTILYKTLNFKKNA